MFVEILVALFCHLIQPTIHHFIGNFDECTASKVCNHTWTPICGYLEVDSTYRLFLDDCDLHEYNCENSKTYAEVDTKVCSQNCTQHDHAEMSTTPMPSNNHPPQKTVVVMTEKVTRTFEITTKAEATTLKETDATTVRGITIASTDALITSIETKHGIIEKSDNNINDDSNTNDIENTISEETTRSVSVAATRKLKLGCNSEHCTMPSTWETTSVGETRDFVQILRERYGDRIKFLKGTREPTRPVYARKSDTFIPGRHIERRTRLLF